MVEDGKGKGQGVVGAEDVLGMVKHWLIEFHGVGENSLLQIVEFLEEQGLGVEVSKVGVKVNPDKVDRVTGLALVEAVRKK